MKEKLEIIFDLNYKIWKDNLKKKDLKEVMLKNVEMITDQELEKRERKRKREKWEADSKEKAAAALLLGALLDGLDGLGNLAHEINKNIIDIDLLLGRRLHERAVEAAREGLALLDGDDALVLEVAFVADQNHRHGVAVLHPQNLFAQLRQVVERRLRHDAVRHREPLPVFHVQVSHCCELLCPGRIQNFEHVLLAVDFQRFAIRIFDCGIVLLHENSLYKLHCQC